jgi:hypothetical protein
MTATVIEPLGTAATVPSAAPLHYLSCRWCGSAAEAGRLLCPVCGASGLVRQISAGVGTVRRLLGAIGGASSGSSSSSSAGLSHGSAPTAASPPSATSGPTTTTPATGQAQQLLGYLLSP